jgi:hypothetical protein
MYREVIALYLLQHRPGYEVRIVAPGDLEEDGSSPDSEIVGVWIMGPYEPQPGMLVRVKERHWRSEFGGMLGTVEHRWGHPDHPALDVRLDDGRLVLFWFHKLDEVS